MIYAKELREKLARVSTQMRALIDVAKADNNRGLSADERTKFDAMVDEFDQIEASIKRAEKVDTIENDLRGVDRDRIIDQLGAADPKAKAKESEELHARAFGKYLRGGMETLNSAERQFMAAKLIGGIQNAQSNTNSQGGYLIPQGFSGQLEEALKWFGGIVGVIGEINTETGNPLPWPTVNDTGNTGRIIGQNVQVTETDLAFSQVTFNSFIFSSDSVLVPLSLMQDSYFDLDAFVARALGMRLGRLINTKMTVGTGSSEPSGIVTAANTAGLTYTVPTGGTVTISYNDLVELEHKVDKAYRDQAKYMFHDTTLKALKKLVDSSNRPLWQPALTSAFGAGAQPTILDHSYVINNDMPTMTANAKSVLFGDFSQYKMRRVAGGTTVLRLVERYADFLQVGFIGFTRLDGNLLDAGTHPIAVLINSAT